MAKTGRGLDTQRAVGGMAAYAVPKPAVVMDTPGTPEQVDTSGLVHPTIKEQLQTAPEYEADLVVIGAGPAGYVGAIRAAQLGARTVVVEKGSVGGACLNVGCIPTKVLLACAAAFDHVRNAGEFGVNVKGQTLDFAKMMARKENVVKQLVGGVEALFRKNKIRLVRGAAKIKDAHTVVVQAADGEQTIPTEKILIATGSEPASLPLPGLEFGNGVWSSTEALKFDAAPKSMLIVGAGAIGLEAGYMFASLGTEVLVVEAMSQILPAADTETAEYLQKRLEAAGMKFMLNTTVFGAEDTKTGKKVMFREPGSRDTEGSDSGEQAAEFEKVLVAVGRRAVLRDVGLEEAGVKHDGRKIIVNRHMQTNVPGIYAAGDCVGEPMLAHVAWTEAIMAVEHAFGMDSRMDYSAFPTCVYTKPEFASVGLTDQQAKERYRDVRVGRYSFAHNGKALGTGEADGFVKFVTEPRYGQILGVHMVGPQVTDLISEAVLAIKNELTVQEVFSTIHPHPTLSEVVQEAAYDSEGRAIHK